MRDRDGYRMWRKARAVFAFAMLALGEIAGATSATGADQSPPSWRAIIRPADKALIDPTDALIRRLLDSIEADAEYVTSGRDSFDPRDLRALLKPGTRTEAADLVGRWRCRSIQPTRDAVYVYGYFQCEITFGDGVLAFRKTTGSQLRHGALYPDDGTRLIFLGRGNSLKKGLQSAYGDPPVEGSYFDLDSVGVFFQRSRGKATAIFASEAYGYEIYDLRRD